MKSLWILALLLVASPCFAQEPTCAKEAGKDRVDWAKSAHSWIADALHKERSELRETWCLVGESHDREKVNKIEDFGRVFFTGEGLHPAFGGIVPGSGTAIGGVFSLERASASTPLRFAGSVESRISLERFWVVGGKLNIVGSGNRRDNHHNFAAVRIRRQNLPELTYYGLGPDTTRSAAAGYGLDTTTSDFTFHLAISHGLSLVGSVASVSASPKQTTDPDATLAQTAFSPTDTPALTTQTTHIVSGGGIEWIYPATERLRGYSTAVSVTLRGFHATKSKPYSFRRFDTQWSNRWSPDTAVDLGTFETHARLALSVATGGNAVPFYLQPTIGGTDIDNEGSLLSYQDYRFRAPHALVVGGSYEHKVIDPIGIFAGYDAGRVAMTRDDLSLRHLRHSIAAGLTLRAGGRTVVRFAYAWGDEGVHSTFGGNTNDFVSAEELRGVF